MFPYDLKYYYEYRLHVLKKEEVTTQIVIVTSLWTLVNPQTTILDILLHQFGCLPFPLN